MRTYDTNKTLIALLAFHEQALARVQGVLEAEGNIYSDLTKREAEATIRVHTPFIDALKAVIREPGKTWMHVRRGGVYEELGALTVQCDTLVQDEDTLTLYQGSDGRLWGRPPAEFNDGRFCSVVKSKVVVPEVAPVEGKVKPVMTVEGDVPEDLEIEVILKTGEMDDRRRVMTIEQIREIVRSRRLHVTYETDPDDEDMWGDYYLATIAGNARPGPVVMELKRQ